LQKLLPHFPEYRSESQFLHGATLLGLWLLAVEARRPGLEPLGGYEAADLAALIEPRILAALDFLAEQGRLPALLGMNQGSVAGVTSPVPAPALPLSGELTYDPDVADDMTDLGTDLLED
jgi:hypothetical protein